MGGVWERDSRDPGDRARVLSAVLAGSNVDTGIMSIQSKEKSLKLINGA